jgi:antitoxin component of MazEF toxin-antitoxin module
VKNKSRGVEKERDQKTRKVINHGGSYYICLPKSFVQRHNLAPGDKVSVLVGENLKITPYEKAN